MQVNQHLKLIVMKCPIFTETQSMSSPKGLNRECGKRVGQAQTLASRCAGPLRLYSQYYAELGTGVKKIGGL